MAGIEDNAARSLTVSAAGTPPPFRAMEDFVAALKAAERIALRQAYVWYMPLLRDQARKAGVAADECDELSATVLGNVLLHIQKAHVPPRDFARYLVGALRNRARNLHRDRRRVAQTQEYAYTHPGDGRERIVAECHSEYGVRASGGVMTVPLRSAIEKLALKSAEQMNDVDLALMIGLSHHVPLRELAEQGGITYGAARVRVHRLREKFHRLAMQHVSALGGEERREMLRFFRRAGITVHGDGSPPRDDANREAPHDTE